MSALTRVMGPIGMFLVAVSACSSQTPSPESPPSSEDEAASAEPTPEATPDSSGEAPATGDDASAEPEATSEPAPPAEPLSKLCNQMCDAVAPKCTPLQLKGCKSTCDNYDTYPGACDGVVRGALECARADKDFLFCANVVPDSCAKQFKAANTCKETGQPPADAAAAGMPAGWERYKGPGFSVVVPKGMKAVGDKKWSVQSASGVTYEVTIHPPPTGKLNNRSFLLAGNKIFGPCSPKLKLHALVEKERETSIQYKTTCPDGKMQVGRMHVIGDQMFVMSAYTGTSENPETEAFVYSFESN